MSVAVVTVRDESGVQVVRVEVPRPVSLVKVGTPGARGTQGLPGLSAYDVAVAEGFEGTEEEWLASLADGSFSRLDFQAMITPGTPPPDFATLYLTGTGTSPARTLELKLKNELGDEITLASWTV